MREVGHRRLAHRRVSVQRVLDLAELHPEAADLHLLVDAAEELEGAVAAVACQVAGQVEALARRRRKGEGDEALRGPRGPAQVPPSHSRAADRDLPGDAEGRESQPAVQKQDLGFADRAADRQHVFALRPAAPLGGPRSSLRSGRSG